MSKYLILFLILVAFSSCKKQKIVFDSIANDQFELSLMLRLNGKDCAFDSKLKLLKYSIDESALMNFSTFIEFQKIATIQFNNISLINNAINNLGDLELNKVYDLTISTNGTSTKFGILFTDIPIIQIVTHDEILNEPKSLSKMTLNYPQFNRPSDINWTGIELRGATGLKFDKKSYGIGIYNDRSLENPSSAAFFDLNTNKKWILNGMFIDKSKIRNKVSFDLWKSMAGNIEHVNVESRYVEVFVNHSAKGLYVLTEKYTEQQLNLDQQAVFYEGVDNSDVTEFKVYPSKKPTSAEWEGWEQLFPEPSQVIEWTDFENLSQLIAKGTDSDFKNNIGQLIDLDNVIDYYLLLNICYGTDNLGKNWHFLKRSPAAKFQIVPWDLDGSWGRNPVATPLGYAAIASNHFYRRLEELNPDNYNARLKQRWLELRSTAFLETNISNLFNDNFEILEQYKIIPFENNLWQTDINLISEQAYMNNWLTNRLIFLDDYFN